MKVQLTVAVKLTATEWELYTCSMKCGNAARKLNAAASKALNAANKLLGSGADLDTARRAAWDIWMPVAWQFSEFGAADSEPRWRFDDLVLKYVG